MIIRWTSEACYRAANISARNWHAEVLEFHGCNTRYQLSAHKFIAPIVYMNHCDEEFVFRYLQHPNLFLGATKYLVYEGRIKQFEVWGELLFYHDWSKTIFLMPKHQKELVGWPVREIKSKQLYDFRTAISLGNTEKVWQALQN
jgi:hypothetical protein